MFLVLSGPVWGSTDCAVELLESMGFECNLETKSINLTLDVRVVKGLKQDYNSPSRNGTSIGVVLCLPPFLGFKASETGYGPSEWCYSFNCVKNATMDQKSFVLFFRKRVGNKDI